MPVKKKLTLPNNNNKKNTAPVKKPRAPRKKRLMPVAVVGTSGIEPIRAPETPKKEKKASPTTAVGRFFLWLKNIAFMD